MVQDYLSFFVSLFLMMGLSYWLLNKVFKNFFITFPVVFLKYSFFAIYFLWFIKINPIVLSDDQNYYVRTVGLFERNSSLLSYFSMNGFGQLGSAAGGYHFGYYYYCLISFKLFGVNYYSPVLLNIFLTTCASISLFKILKMGNFKPQQAKFILILFVLHWDILSWSSFLNLKDCVVLSLNIFSMYYIVKISKKGFKIKDCLKLILILLLFLPLRFYYPFFIFLSAFIYFLILRINVIAWKWKPLFLRFLILFLLPATFYIVFIVIFSSFINSIGPKTNILLGTIRYLITPFPLNIDSNYNFILLASCLHWITMPLAIYGFYVFVKKYFINLLPLLIISLLLIVFYGSFAELQGPRHRLPLISFMAIVQGIGLYEVLKLLVRHSTFSSKNVKLEIV